MSTRLPKASPMDICFITDNPETKNHPVIGRVIQLLSLNHTMRVLDVASLTGDEAFAQERERRLADIYLLKSHALQALEVAAHLEQAEALVVNSPPSSLACRDRVLMAQRMEKAHLPCPHTWSFSSIEELQEKEGCLATLAFPLIIKSRHSYRGDLVGTVSTLGDLQALLARRKREPLILQEFAQGDGWDVKLWIIGQQVFAARRRSTLEAGARKDDFPIPAQQLPAAWRSIALQVGRVFDLLLYGLDLVITEKGPVIVDVNSFPGFRGVPGADSALVSLIEGLVSCRRTSMS